MTQYTFKSFDGSTDTTVVDSNSNVLKTLLKGNLRGSANETFKAVSVNRW